LQSIKGECALVLTASTWLINRRHHIPSITAASGGNGKDARRAVINGILTTAAIHNTEKKKFSMHSDVQELIPSGKLWYVTYRRWGVVNSATMISAIISSTRAQQAQGSFEATMRAAIASKRTLVIETKGMNHFTLIDITLSFSSSFRLASQLSASQQKQGMSFSMGPLQPGQGAFRCPRSASQASMHSW
jgi:hypothetical protein